MLATQQGCQLSSTERQTHTVDPLHTHPISHADKNNDNNNNNNNNNNDIYIQAALLLAILLANKCSTLAKQNIAK